MSSLTDRLKIILQSLETLNIPATFENMNALLGVNIELRKLIASFEKEENHADLPADPE